MTNQVSMCDCLGCAVGGCCEVYLPNPALVPLIDRAPCCGTSPMTDLFDPAKAAAITSTAQQRFDAAYISSLAIAERLGVSRPAVLHARRRGVLPDPVCVNDGQIYIWERAQVEPYLVAWENSVKLRRGEPVVVCNPTGPGHNWVKDAFAEKGSGND